MRFFFLDGNDMNTFKEMQHPLSISLVRGLVDSVLILIRKRGVTNKLIKPKLSNPKIKYLEVLSRATFKKAAPGP